MPAAIAAIATTPTPTPQNHGVFAAVRKHRRCDRAAAGSARPTRDRRRAADARRPADQLWRCGNHHRRRIGGDARSRRSSAGMPWRDPESRRSRLRSAPMSAAVW